MACMPFSEKDILLFRRDPQPPTTSRNVKSSPESCIPWKLLKENLSNVNLSLPSKHIKIKTGFQYLGLTCLNSISEKKQNKSLVLCYVGKSAYILGKRFGRVSELCCIGNGRPSFNHCISL